MSADKIINKYLKQAVKSSIEDVLEYARTHHSFVSRSGKLERSVVSKQSSDGLSGKVFIDTKEAPYGVYVHDGSKPHIIVPRFKKALHWENENGEFFAKRVRHPGYKGDPFLFNALESRQGQIEKIFENRIEAAMRELAKEL